jgi:hypothetical protein
VAKTPLQKTASLAAFKRSAFFPPPTIGGAGQKRAGEEFIWQNQF